MRWMDFVLGVENCLGGLGLVEMEGKEIRYDAMIRMIPIVTVFFGIGKV